MSSAPHPPTRDGPDNGADTEPEAAPRLFPPSAIGRFPRLRGTVRSDELRRKLSRVIEAHAAAAAERAIAGHTAQDDAERLDELQKLLAALPRRGDLSAALVVAALCLVFASFTLIDTPTTAFDLAVTTSAVQLRLAAPLMWPAWKLAAPAGPKGGEKNGEALAVTLVSDVNRIDLPPEFDHPDPLVTRASLTMEGGHAKLTDLELDPGVVVTLTRDLSGAINLRLLNAPPAGARDFQGVRGKFAIAGDAVLTADGASGSFTKTLRRTDEPVSVTFSDDGVRTVPVYLRLYPAESVGLPRLQIDQLSLKPNESMNLEGQQSFTSGIDKGSLIVPDTGDIIDIKGADITLTGASGYISALEITPEGIAFNFEGDAKNVSIGPPRYARNVRVNWLEYFLHHDKYKTLWTIVLALWGIAWGVRKMVAAR